jgi:hypothetical protein
MNSKRSYQFLVALTLFEFFNTVHLARYANLTEMSVLYLQSPDGLKQDSIGAAKSSPGQLIMSSLPQHQQPRVLMGIFSTRKDMKNYSAKFRALFELHPLVCSLGNYEREQQEASSKCQFVYTFVLAGNKSPNAPTVLLDEGTPILTKRGDDYAFLNIKENMNDGMSQTWFYYATTLVKTNKNFNFDYIGKMDIDTLIYLDQYFAFANEYLHPAPHNTIIGLMTTKTKWSGVQKEREKFFHSNFGDNHQYPQGETFRIQFCVLNYIRISMLLSLIQVNFTFFQQIWLKVLSNLHRVKIILGMHWRGLRTMILEPWPSSQPEVNR